MLRQHVDVIQWPHKVSWVGAQPPRRGRQSSHPDINLKPSLAHSLERSSFLTCTGEWAPTTPSFLTCGCMMASTEKAMLVSAICWRLSLLSMWAAIQITWWERGGHEVPGG